jgi:hypothetical protein
LADPILVDGDPLENLDLVDDPDTKLVVIMKVVMTDKNTIQ